ncbi:hypothetical protein ASG40_04275 [Methylobacterium sp. Leaf399]|uniref:hypothetical protein n=1 Tax=Methylobacterium sp. Leaf399 TaxID=1736364 RepID=UPI00070084E5|nr:hypothetical protein [Methylobacterium sp. Leaf399]KQT20018.1 hypothetical protein ASG40_04275 [Methylobacterium sp. Leaf399]
MDGFYRGVEASLLALSLALGLGAWVATAPIGTTDALQIAVVLPMLSVTAGHDGPPRTPVSVPR